MTDEAVVEELDPEVQVVAVLDFAVRTGWPVIAPAAVTGWTFVPGVHGFPVAVRTNAPPRQIT